MIIFPPTNLKRVNEKYSHPKLFLAGSNESNTAFRWQDKIAIKAEKLGFIVLNPFREELNNAWDNTFENANFVQQVNWELDGIEIADYVLFYFDKNTKAAVIMLELGYCIGKSPKKIAVVCSDEYFRKGNIDIICYNHNILQFDTIESALDSLVLNQLANIKQDII